MMNKENRRGYYITLAICIFIFVVLNLIAMYLYNNGINLIIVKILRSISIMLYIPIGISSYKCNIKNTSKKQLGVFYAIYIVVIVFVLYFIWNLQ